MALKELRKSTRQKTLQTEEKILQTEESVKVFIDQGGSQAAPHDDRNVDHRLTLRIPTWLMDKIDAQRKERVGKISRNLWILELVEKATKK